MILSRVAISHCRTWTVRCLLSAAIGILALTASAFAQQTPEMVFEPAPGATPAQASASASGFPRSHIQGAPDPEDPGVGGLGILGRVGHIAGNTIERNQSITYFDLAPYLFVEETYFFGEARLFLTNQGRVGGSTGLGVRHYFPERDFVFGASAWYDHDESRPAAFEQLGMSLEIFSQWMDVRSNYYTAIGNNVKSLGTTIIPGSAQFVGNNVSFATQTKVSTGADMVDLMFTVPIPGEIAQSMNLEASAGWYEIFTPGLSLKNVNGFKLRVDADFLERVVHFYSELSQDSFFDTNIVAGVDVNYWHHLESRPRFGSSQFNRIAQWVRRNRNVVTLDSQVANPAQLAINPNTGNPYFLYHVRNVPPPSPLPNFPAPTGDGTIAKPFQFIDEAQAAGNPDLIFVHADSVYDNRAVVLKDGELVLGEGVAQSIPVQGIGQQLQLPRATNGANRPILQNTVGTAVTLADNNLFAGFDINATQGTAILGSGINGGTIRDVRINGTTGVGAHGVELLNDTGTINLQSVNISATEGNAFYVSGGNAAVVYNSGVISNTSGFAVLLEDNGGSVNMTGSIVNDIGGQGVEVINSTAANTFGALNLSQTNGDAISIINLFGTATLFSDTTINGPTGDGILIRDSSGTVSSLGSVTINNRNGVGINILRDSGTVSFTNNVTMGTPASGGVLDHGINFQGSSGTARFQGITINGSSGSGINIGGPAVADQNTGSFSVLGFTSISNAALASVNVLNDASSVTFNGLTIIDRGARGINIDNDSGTTNFGGLISIQNGLSVGQAAVSVQNSSGQIQLNNVVASATVGPEPGVWVTNNTGSTSFNSLSVQSTATTAVEITNNSAVSVSGGVVDATGARGVTMIDNKAFGVVFDAVSSTNSDYGIFISNDIALFDHPGTFIVTGDGQQTSTGGTISGQTIAGASVFNTNVVNLGFIDISGNAVGVTSNDVNQLTLAGNAITGSTSFGIDILNNSNVAILRNAISDNEGFNQIRIRASQVLTDTTGAVTPYVVVIRNNTVTDATLAANVGLGDMIAISTLSTANGSALDLTVANNGNTDSGGFIGFSANRTFGTAAFSTVWNGDVLANITGNNTRLSTSAGDIGFRFVTTRTSGLNDITYQGNVLNSGGGGFDTGLLCDFAGSTVLHILDNFGVDTSGNPVVDGFLMGNSGDVNDTAIDLTFRSTGNVIDISRNHITFNSADGTGIVFRTISGPSSVNMDGNAIIMFDDGFTPNELGILFQSVVGSITLSSTAGQNNTVLPAGFNTVRPLTIPNGVSTGSFLINGARVP